MPAKFRMGKCVDCARTFLESEHGMKRCRLCSALRADDIDMAMAEQAWEKGYQLGYTRGQQARVGDPAVSVPLPILEAAIKFCHPDWHPEERFQNANALTAELIRIRDNLRNLKTQPA